MTTKRELLNLLDEVKYSEFFEALGNNKVVHHSLSKLRKDFIHSGDNKAEYNERCRDFVNFYLNDEGRLAVIPPRYFPYLLFALISLALSTGVYFAFFHQKPISNTTQTAEITQKQTWEFSGTVKIITENGQEMFVKWQNDAYQTTKAYTSGTKFRLKLQHDSPLFVYILTTDDTKEISQIYPLVDGNSVSQKSLSIPTDKETDFIQMNAIKGTDILCILYAQEELDINKLKTNLQSSSGGFAERLAGSLGEKLCLKADFQTNSINFLGKTDKTIFAVLVQISHN